MRALESQFFSIYLNLLTFTFDNSRRVNPQWDIMFTNGVKNSVFYKRQKRPTRIGFINIVIRR